MGAKSIFRWPDLKVTVVNGKVASFTEIDPVEKQRSQKERAVLARERQLEIEERKEQLAAENKRRQALREQLAKEAEADQKTRDIIERAKAGDPKAQLQLGQMYLEGKGVQQSDQQAAEWIQKAVDQHDIRAEYQLGMLYLAGRGVPQSKKEAFKWVKRAADRGYPRAFVTVGDFYAQGTGVFRNDKNAYMWFVYASYYGSSVAKEKMEVMAAFLSETEIREATSSASIAFGNEARPVSTIR
ncbi:MAG: hypothetical protein AB3N33_00450 [Puniceicoccaceae bacterium]